MLNSLRAWCIMPLVYKKCKQLLATGEKLYAAASTITCYRVGETVEVTDKNGQKYVSMTQLYIPEGFDIDNDDMFEDDNKFVVARKISRIYDADTGLLDLYVIYL